MTPCPFVYLLLTRLLIVSVWSGKKHAKAVDGETRAETQAHTMPNIKLTREMGCEMYKSRNQYYHVGPFEAEILALLFRSLKLIHERNKYRLGTFGI